MPRSSYALVPALLGCLTGAAHAANVYEMKDLEALEKQEAWQETVEHLGDIMPTKRNDAWQRIADRASAGYLAGLDGQKMLQAAADLTKRYPTLKKSKAFMASRAETGLKAFQKTYGDSRHSAYEDPWMDQLKAFVEEDALTGDLPMRAGKLVAKRLVAYLAMPFFKKAINGATGPGACKDADVKNALSGGLAAGVYTEDAKALVEKFCFAEVKAGLEAELAKESNDKAIDNVCPIFKARKVANAACK